MKDSQCYGEKKKTKEQTIIYKTLHRKLRMEQHEPHQAPYATPVVKLLMTRTSSDMEIVLDTSITKNNINKT
jgi:hypothetical protein